MNILEKEIEDLIFDALTNNPLLLEERGISFYDDNYIRQPELGAYGRPDIIGYTVAPKKCSRRHIYITIVELKKDEVNIGTLLQACRYRTGIEHYFKTLDLKGVVVNFRIVLIGRYIDTKSDFTFIIPSLEDIEVYTYALDMEKGLMFYNHYDYYQTIPQFPKHKKNISKIREVLKTKIETAPKQPMEDLPF